KHRVDPLKQKLMREQEFWKPLGEEGRSKVDSTRFIMWQICSPLKSFHFYNVKPEAPAAQGGLEKKGTRLQQRSAVGGGGRSSNPYYGTRLAFGGPRSLQQRSAVGGRGERTNLAPVKPARRHHPPAVVLYAGSDGVFGDPPTSRGFLWLMRDVREGGSTAEAGTSMLTGTSHLQSRLGRSPQHHAGGSQLMSLILRPSVVLTAASAPSPASVPAPRRRLPADVSRSPTSVVLTAASTPAPAPVPAPVPAPRRRLSADVLRVSASEILAVPAPVLAPRPGPRAGLRTALPSLQTLSLSGHGAVLLSLRTLSRSGQGAVLLRSSRVWLLTGLQVVPAEPLNSVPERPRRCPHEPQNSALVRPQRRPPSPLRSAPKRPRGRRVETMYFVPDWPPGRPPEKPPCCVPVRPRGRPPETLCQVPKRPRSRRSENLGTSRSPSSGSPLLPPDSVHVMDRLESGP
ncbi:unnamed protein product, partial [Pleuronectes platessa]